MTAEEPAERPAVIVMARVPRLGEGKTRLRSALSDEECLRLQEAFARDAVAVAMEAELGPVYLAYTPAEAAAWAEDAFGDRVAAFPQQGDDLGARMVAALGQVEALGFAPQVMIGTDAPLLQPRHLRAALQALDNADVCLGPSEDGGYYLVACRTTTRALFEGIRWGTSEVFDATIRQADESCLRMSLLDTLYDIDTPDDLARLRGELAALTKERTFRLPKHTAEVLLA